VITQQTYAFKGRGVTDLLHDADINNMFRWSFFWNDCSSKTYSLIYYYTTNTSMIAASPN
jgi:hypothetical protein